MDTDNFSHEFLQEQEIISKRAAMLLQAKKRGVIPLAELLLFIAGEAYREQAQSPDLISRSEASLHHYEGMRGLLLNAKRDILNGNLTIRERVTNAPINNDASIQKWCNENDALPSSWGRLNNRIAVKLDEAREWLRRIGITVPDWLDPATTPEMPKPEEKPIRDRERETYLHIIGAMLGLMTGETPTGKPNSIFRNQSAVIEALIENYSGNQGIAKRTLGDKFSEAKKSLKPKS